MANQDHFAILKQGVKVWNDWRRSEPSIVPDLADVDLTENTLNEIDFSKTNLENAIFNNASLNSANFEKANMMWTKLGGTKLKNSIFRDTKIQQANFLGADLRETDFSYADIRSSQIVYANLSNAQLSFADIRLADLRDSKFIGAILRQTNLMYATLVDTDFSRADLSGSRIFGISAWNVNLTDAIQTDLVITPSGEFDITLDNLEVAQFIYLLLNNQKIRNVIETITTKLVLILGRFTSERKAVLDAIRKELRMRGYLPVLFDFDKPATRDITETVRTIAYLAHFIIADLTDPSSIPQELQAIVPDLAIAVQPVLQTGKREHSMFVDFRKYTWVLPIHHYNDINDLLKSLDEKVIAPAEAKATELKQRFVPPLPSSPAMTGRKSDVATLRVEWVKQGEIKWEKWYVEKKGYLIDKIPGLKDHISFANFDLKKNGCPPIVVDGKTLEVQDVPSHKLRIATQVLTYHGFKIIEKV